MGAQAEGQSVSTRRLDLGAKRHAAIGKVEHGVFFHHAHGFGKDCLAKVERNGAWLRNRQHLGGDLLGGSQILLQVQRAHRQHVPVVVKPVAHVVVGEVVAHVERHPKEVVDGVGVFKPVEAADGDAPRVGQLAVGGKEPL